MSNQYYIPTSIEANPGLLNDKVEGFAREPFDFRCPRPVLNAISLLQPSEGEQPQPNPEDPEPEPLEEIVQEFHSDVSIEGEEYIPPPGLFIPGLYTPGNHLARANGLAFFYPKVRVLSVLTQVFNVISFLNNMFTAEILVKSYIA